MFCTRYKLIVRSIIVIPAVGLSCLSEWVDASGTPWLEHLVDNVFPRAAVWEYVYSSNGQGSLTRQLLEEGPLLLQALHNKFALAVVCRTIPLVARADH